MLRIQSRLLGWGKLKDKLFKNVWGLDGEHVHSLRLERTDCSKTLVGATATPPPRCLPAEGEVLLRRC